MFDQIVATVSSSDDLLSCWQDALKITGQRGNEVLASAGIQSDLDHVVSQELRNVLDADPPSFEIQLL